MSQLERAVPYSALLTLARRVDSRQVEIRYQGVLHNASPLGRCSGFCSGMFTGCPETGKTSYSRVETYGSDNSETCVFCAHMRIRWPRLKCLDLLFSLGPTGFDCGLVQLRLFGGLRFCKLICPTACFSTSDLPPWNAHHGLDEAKICSMYTKQLLYCQILASPLVSTFELHLVSSRPCGMGEEIQRVADDINNLVLAYLSAKFYAFLMLSKNITVRIS